MERDRSSAGVSCCRLTAPHLGVERGLFARESAALSVSANPAVRPPPGLAATGFVVDGKLFALVEWHVTPAADLPPQLTSAEMDVAELLLAGLSNAEIARRRRTSPRTVANQIANIFEKLGVHSRYELFARTYIT